MDNVNDNSSPKPNPNALLPKFLRELADMIESGRLDSERLQRIGEFYMSYLFEENNRESPQEEFNEKDFRQFLTLGWYAYSYLIPK